jgi:uncharacterized protein DUF1569
MRTLFDRTTYEDIVRRVESLQPGAERHWGKMTAAQMLEHSARALEMAAGKTPSKQAFLGKAIGWIFRSNFVGEKPLAKNAPTGPDFVVTGIEPDFRRTQERLKTLLAEFYEIGEEGCDGHIHGFFGRMTGAEWGSTQYKHLDHHLRQFGV